MLQETLIEKLKKDGADIITFSNIDNFREKKKILEIMPETKTVICVACRQLRGSRRGIEEGSTYYQYTTTAVETLEEIIIPSALLRGCNLLEEYGFEAMPQKRCQLILQDENETNFEMQYDAIYRGVDAETIIDFEKCAEDANLGEISLMNTILTDEYGPMQRWGFIFTDAVLTETPKNTPHLCDKCGKCINACPGMALSKDGNRDSWQCAAYYLGANQTKNPFMPPDAYAENPNRNEIMAGKFKLNKEQAQEVLDETFFYPPIKNAYVSSICGKACETACYIHLETKGVLTKKFNRPFRRKKEWVLPLDIK